MGWPPAELDYCSPWKQTLTGPIPPQTALILPLEPPGSLIGEDLSLANIYKRLLCRVGGEPRWVLGTQAMEKVLGRDRMGWQSMAAWSLQHVGPLQPPHHPPVLGTPGHVPLGCSIPPSAASRKLLKPGSKATHPGGGDHLVTGSVIGGGEMCFYHREKQIAFVAERGGLGRMESPAPCQVVQMPRSHTLLLGDNSFACKWADSSILSSQIFFFQDPPESKIQHLCCIPHGHSKQQERCWSLPDVRYRFKPLCKSP